jgi:hypothetical protein
MAKTDLGEGKHTPRIFLVKFDQTDDHMHSVDFAGPLPIPQRPAGPADGSVLARGTRLLDNRNQIPGTSDVISI